MSVEAAPRSGSAYPAAEARAEPGRERARALRLAVVVALGALSVALQLRLRGDAELWTQVAGQLVAFGLYLPVAWLAWRGLGFGRAGLVLVLAFGVGFRAAAFVPGDTPPLSTDLHRYAWDARVQASGVNPYRYAPGDPALAGLRDEVVWPRINLPDWNTVYPPGAQATFLAARGVFGHGLRATTWLFLVLEAAAVALLLLVLARARLPLDRIALYAWHPLVVSEIAANGHVDAVAVFGLAALLAAWRARRFALAGAAVACVALVKLAPILLVPALARGGGRRFVLVAVALIVLAYVPYLSVGGAVVTNLEPYLERQRFGGSLAWALRPSLGDATPLLMIVGLAALLVVVGLREHERLEQVARTCLLVLGGILIVLDYVQPWYALWLVPFFVLTAAPGWLWLTGTLPLLYLFGIDRDLPGWVRATVYGGFAAAVLWRVVRPRRPPPAALPRTLAAMPRVVAVVPALNEEAALPGVLAELPAGVLDDVVVVDGGSTDATPERARNAGARVLVEPRRGYGRACATGAAAAADADVLVFLDGDGSDDPAELGRVLAPVLAGEAALALGSRIAGERGALHGHQRVGNALVSLLVRRVYGVPVHDVPPFRAIRRDVLEGLAMRELSYGWPTEMLVKAARDGLPIVEVAVRARPRRGGESKIAGRALPSLAAGARMLAVVARYA